MSNLDSILSNPFVKRRILRLPDGGTISADKYIEKYVLPKIGDAETITLRKGKTISIKQFVNKYVFTVCQRDYKGNFDRLYNDYVADNINDFFRNNRVNFQRISKMPEARVYNIYNYYSVISKYIIYNDPVLTKKSVADIVGIVSEPVDYDASNIANNLGLYFSKSPNKVVNYNNRADTMLDYSSDNIISGLSSSFNKEPMVVTELENGGALISENGLHRYHLLRIHYLNELMRASSQSEKDMLRNKYMIPVKMETIDLFKTYSNFLLGLSDLPMHLTKRRNDRLQQTNDSIIHYNHKQYLFNDRQLVEFLRENLNRMEDRKSTINKLCECIPSFNKYINLYFPELVMANENRRAFR